MSKAGNSDPRPLVSIICRTVGRPELDQALASVAAQDYGNLQLVLVNAACGDPAGLPDSLPEIQLKLVNPDSPLDRAAAANWGLRAADGELLMFLDEDDWIDAGHVSGLVQALQGQDTYQAAYSNTAKMDPAGEKQTGLFNLDFDINVLRRDNFIPIHAMLFSRELVEKGCQFEESLAIYEDWDFWLQLSMHTEFLHVHQLTAFYREGGDSATAVKHEQAKYSPQSPNAQAREKVLARWLPRWDATNINQMLGSLDHSQELVQLHEKLRGANSALEEKDRHIEEAERKLGEVTAHRDNEQAANKLLDIKLEKIRESYGALKQQQRALTEELRDTQARHEQLRLQLHEITSSFAWKFMAVYRAIARPVKSLLRPVARRLGLIPPVTGQAVQSSTSTNPGEMLPVAVDVPGEQPGFVSRELLVQGWSFSESGPVTVEAYIDGLLFNRFVPSVPRPDVAGNFPEYPQADSCGFSQRFGLNFIARGKHSLRLVFRSDTGGSVEIERVFYYFPEPDIYDFWVRNQQPGPAQTEATGSERDVQLAVVIQCGDQPETRQSLTSLASQASQVRSLLLLGDEKTTPDALIAQSGVDGNALAISRLAGLQGLADELAKLEGYVLFMEAGEYLMPGALTAISQVLSRHACDLLYSDHDLVDGQGFHSSPVFTPGWSPERVFADNYTGCLHVRAVSSQLVEDIRGCETANWRYELLLEATRQALNVERVPGVLWSALEGRSETGRSSEMDALSAYLARNGIEAGVTSNEGKRSIRWPLQSRPRVSVVIPTMGKLELLKPCLLSLLENTRYDNYEIIMLDNSRGQYPEGIEFLHQQGLKVIEVNEPFNWARLNNIGAGHADGDYLLFLNDDIEKATEHHE